MYVHGPDLWSSVFPIQPFTGLILVCADDLPDNCMQLYGDTPDLTQAIQDFRNGVVHSFGSRRQSIAKGYLPPDPQPLPATP